MRIFLAGGTGVIGRRLIPALVSAGHLVTATTRHAARSDGLAASGARPVVVDVYDAARLATAVAEAAPELALHELTDLSDADTDANARLRVTGTENLVAAAQAAGVQRMMLQSIAWAYAEGEGPATETDPIPPASPVAVMEEVARRLPHATALRYGLLYGPDTWYAPGARMAQAVAAGLVPATAAITSFAHVDDVVAATVQAIDWPDGAYNIVDDDPAPGSEWLPAYAAELGAPAPPIGGVPEGAPVGRGASNTKAKQAGWTPMHPSWREGFLRA